MSWFNEVDSVQASLATEDGSDHTDPASDARTRRRNLRLGGSVAVLLSLFAVLLTVEHASDTPMRRPLPGAALQQRFVTLSAAHTNSCGLQGGGLTKMDPRSRLQGSCCSPMNSAAYAEQRRKLTAYSHETAIPSDPYDVSAELAQRLLRYRSIVLTPSQGAEYAKAVSLSDEHGPCCCHCWRWDAFEGQAKYLITSRQFSAAGVAAVWDLEDGCGGPAPVSSSG